MRAGGGGDGDGGGGGGGGEVRRKEPAMRSIRSAPNNKQRCARFVRVCVCVCGQMHTFVARVNIVWREAHANNDRLSLFNNAPHDVGVVV